MADRLLVEHLGALGVDTTRLAGCSDLELVELAADLELVAGLDLSIEEVAREVGCSVEEARSVFAQLGLPPDGLRGHDDADVAMVASVVHDETGVMAEIGNEILRLTGQEMARLAEASVAAYVQDVEPYVTDPSAQRSGAELVATAEVNAAATRLALRLGSSLPTVYRHHMWAAVRRQREGQEGAAAPQVLTIAIAFVDLAGFTALAATASPGELVAAIEGFEHRAFEIAGRHGGRIVKSIGDEVMVAGRDADLVAAIAADLIDELGEGPAVAAHAGLSAGEVLFRLGDYYGPVVNLASRLSDEALPGEILTDVAKLEHPALVPVPAGRRALRGIAEPVVAFSIERVG